MLDGPSIGWSLQKYFPKILILRKASLVGVPILCALAYYYRYKVWLVGLNPILVWVYDLIP